MKKAILIFSLIVLLTVSAAAYDNIYPANAPFAGGCYVEVQTSQLGRAIIYVGIANKDFNFSVNRGTNTLVNITNGTITGEIYYGTNFNTHTQVRFQRFATAEYNNSTTGTNYVALTVTNVYNTNLLIANQNTQPIHKINVMEVLQIIVVFILGVMMLCLFIKQSRA